VNPTDTIVTALTPGSIFNRNALVFRSVASLAEFTGLAENEVLDILNGDLVALVTCKPSKKGKGILVALTAAIVAQQNEPVVVAAIPVGPGAPIIEVDLDPLDEAPVA